METSEKLEEERAAPKLQGLVGGLMGTSEADSPRDLRWCFCCGKDRVASGVSTAEHVVFIGRVRAGTFSWPHLAFYEGEEVHVHQRELVGRSLPP